jgi:hypothetical protein
MSDRFSLHIGQKKLAALAGREAADIGGTEIVQKGGSVRSGDFDQRCSRRPAKTGSFAEGTIFGGEIILRGV